MLNHISAKDMQVGPYYDKEIFTYIWEPREVQIIVIVWLYYGDTGSN